MLVLNAGSQITPSESRKNTYSSLAIAGVVTAFDVALESFHKVNRQDSFVKTAKACAKSFNKDRKEFVASFCEDILRNKKLAQKVSAIKNNNKKMFALFIGVETLLNFVFFKALSDYKTTKSHKKIGTGASRAEV